MKQKELQNGFYTKKQYNISIGYGIFMGITIILIGLYLINKFGWYGLLYSLIVLVVLFIGLNIVANKTNPMVKILNDINRNCEFEKFKKEIDQIRNENQLSEETINFLNIIESNYLFTYDLEKGKELFLTCYRPSYKPNMIYYDEVRIMYCLNTKEEEKVELAFKDFIKYNPNKKKKINKIKDLIDLNFHKIDENEVEKIFTLHNPISFQNLENAYELMMYFNSIGNIEKTKYYATYILTIHNDMIYYKNIANELLK